MKLLLDANVSYRLVKRLAPLVNDCLHVTRTGLTHPADDIAIWHWAKRGNWIIVTNDDDYYHLANLYGFPPKVVLLRMGNQSSLSVMNTLVNHIGDIAALVDSTEHGMLELF